MRQATDDVPAIEQVIARQFAVMNWSPGKPPDWDVLAGDFLPGATMFPAARPVRPQSVDAFVARMRGLAETGLRSFAQTALGAEIRVFGNVAVAMAACRNVENDTGTARGVEAMLLVKQDGQWRIAAQAWDMEDDANRIPAALLAGAGG